MRFDMHARRPSDIASQHIYHVISATLRMHTCAACMHSIQSKQSRILSCNRLCILLAHLKHKQNCRACIPWMHGRCTYAHHHQARAKPQTADQHSNEASGRVLALAPSWTVAIAAVLASKIASDMDPKTNATSLQLLPQRFRRRPRLFAAAVLTGSRKWLMVRSIRG